jgi:uncharacterized membrane protein
MPRLSYLSLKLIHVVSSTLLFGGGVAAAIFGTHIFRSGNLHRIAEQGRWLLKFDLYLTLPTAIIQTLTGIWMASYLGVSPTSGWMGMAWILLGVVGACWLPGVWLQHRMTAMAQDSLNKATDLPDQYAKLLHTWTLLGLPSTAAMLGVFYLMVFKPV